MIRHMTKAPDLQQAPKLPKEIIQAGLNGDLILFIGAGISRLAKYPTWGELAWKTLNALVKVELLNHSELDQLKQLDAKKQLSIAELIAAEYGFNLDVPQYFQLSGDTPTIYRTINNIGCTCVTTNYDELLSPVFDPEKDLDVRDTSAVSKETVRIFEKDKFFAKHLDVPGTVVHLHGSISNPKEMVVTTKDYLDHYEHEKVPYFLREMFSKKVVLFLGYGLEEVEVLEHILRKGDVKGDVGDKKERRRFALQGYFRSQDPLYQKLHRYYENSFGVHVIGYIRDHNDYAEQETILKDWSSRIEIRKPHLAKDIDLIYEVLGHE